MGVKCAAQRARGPSFLPRVPTTFLLSVGPSSPHPRWSFHLIQGGYFGTTSKNERHPASTLPSSPKSFVKLECCLPQALPNDKTKTNKQTKPSSLKVGPKRKGCNEPKPLSCLFPGEVGRAPTLCAGRTGDKPQRPHAPNRKEQPGEGAGEGRST